MCIARVGKAIFVSGGKARVEFFDGKSLDGVDVSVVNAGEGDYVEVFGNLAITVLGGREAKRRKEAWAEVRRAAMLPPVSASRR